KQSLSSFQIEVGQAANQLSKDSPAWNYAMSRPVESGLVVGIASAGAASSVVGGLAVAGGFNATLAAAGIINGIGWGQTGQAYLQYRATGNQTARNNVRFDLGVSTAAFFGTTRQSAALSLLTATLTVLNGILQQQINAQNSPAKKVN